VACKISFKFVPLKTPIERPPQGLPSCSLCSISPRPSIGLRIASHRRHHRLSRFPPLVTEARTTTPPTPRPLRLRGQGISFPPFPSRPATTGDFFPFSRAEVCAEISSFLPPRLLPLRSVFLFYGPTPRQEVFPAIAFLCAEIKRTSILLFSGACGY
jgi:hypothetical protein